MLDARKPILSSSRTTVSPGAPRSRTSAEIDLRLSSISLHLPNTSIRSACAPLVMNVFVPFTTIVSPRGSKRVVMPVASDPAFGSVACAVDGRVLTMHRRDVLVVVNTGAEAATVEVGDREVLFATPSGVTRAGGTLGVPPHAGALLR